jgi:hypothetical protein
MYERGREREREIVLNVVSREDDPNDRSQVRMDITKDKRTHKDNEGKDKAETAAATRTCGYI